MKIHVSSDGQYPDHIHACPEHPDGSDAGKNSRGERISDACFWEEDHDETYRTKHRREHDKARANPH